MPLSAEGFAFQCWTCIHLFQLRHQLRKQYKGEAKPALNCQLPPLDQFMLCPKTQAYAPQLHTTLSRAFHAQMNLALLAALLAIQCLLGRDHKKVQHLSLPPNKAS